MKLFWNWKSRKIRDQASGEEVSERVLFLNGTIAEESWFDDDVTHQLFFASGDMKFIIRNTTKRVSNSEYYGTNFS